MVFTILFALGLLILCLYYGIFFFRLGRYKGPSRKKNSPSPAKLPPVSVVLAAQNDGDWLRQNLVYLLEQDYPDFEVVVVDYLSTDETQYILRLLAQNYSRLKVVTLTNNANGYQGLKYPFSIGIKTAQNDILLLAEPECIPMDTTQFNWIRSMVSGYVHDHIDIVLGYCGIAYKPSLFNWLQQYDNLDYSVEYLGAAALRHPFTGNGRNLSYRRSLFLKNDGFIYHYYIPYGADDMFVNQNARRRNTAVVLTPEAYTYVQPQPTLRQWHQYRKHRDVTHLFYSFGLKCSRLAKPLSVFLFYLAGALLLVLGTFPWQLLAAVLAFKLAWQIVSTAQAARRLAVKPIIYILSPLFEIYFLVVNTFLSIFPLSRQKKLK
jgi:glycosyltransferase involved in cell wall biosynthesis